MSIATTANVKRGFNCACIKCGEKGGIRLYLDDVTGADTEFSCLHCEAEYSLAEVKETVSQWQKAIEWLESAPVSED